MIHPASQSGAALRISSQIDWWFPKLTIWCKKTSHEALHCCFVSKVLLTPKDQLPLLPWKTLFKKDQIQIYNLMLKKGYVVKKILVFILLFYVKTTINLYKSVRLILVAKQGYVISFLLFKNILCHKS